MLSAKAFPRRTILTSCAAISAFLLLLNISRSSSHHEPVFFNQQAMLRLSEIPFNNDQVSAVCHHSSLASYRTGDPKKRKIYDLFLFSTELDWLHIRLNTLAPFVDYFVIVESPVTFTGLEKPLYLQDHWDDFSQFHDKIIHTVVPDPGFDPSSSTWQREDFLRDALFDNVFPDLANTEKKAAKGDVLIVSDVDEIPKPSAMSVLRHCDIPNRLTLRSHFYYYSFQWMHVGEQWPHPQATVFHGLSNTIKPTHLRNGIGGPWSWVPLLPRLMRWSQKMDLWDAAWHCSSCFATLSQMRQKLESFSHTPLNTPENRDQKTMVERVRRGLDLFGRDRERYRRINNNNDMPTHIFANKTQFSYLLDRDGANAGFLDYGN